MTVSCESGGVNCLPESEDDRSFPLLERLVVQPGPGPAPGGKCGNPYTAHGRFLDHLQRMRHQAKRPFALVDAGERMGWSEYEGCARREWLDRVNGGSSCWDVELETAASGGGKSLEAPACRVLEIGVVNL